MFLSGSVNSHCLRVIVRLRVESFNQLPWSGVPVRLGLSNSTNFHGAGVTVRLRVESFNKHPLNVDHCCHQS